MGGLVVSGMVEAVARAIFDAKPYHNVNAKTGENMRPDWDAQPPQIRGPHLRDARAAIEAMREPTPELIAAAWASIDQSKKAAGIARLGIGPGCREVWSAMIDAALQEQSK